MIRILFLFAFFISSSCKAEPEEEEFIHYKNNAVIQIVNKITAKISYLKIPVNSEKLFNTLKIKAEVCWKSSPYDLTENKILLNIDEKKSGQSGFVNIFKGWMFFSSPAMSALEHPVYDIVAIDCQD
jgi:hypothetical protein